MSSLLRSLLRTDPDSRLNNAEEALAHPFFFGRAPQSAPTNQIVRSAWKAKMVRDYGEALATLATLATLVLQLECRE